MTFNLFGSQSKMTELTTQNLMTPKLPAKQRATRLLDWLTQFLPTAIPPSSEQAILDDSGDVNALLWHRSELENILQKKPSALTAAQKQSLAALDKQMRQSALLIVGAEKGELRRFREGRYDRSHWWWYLDDILMEENLVCNQPKAKVSYAVPEEAGVLLKVAESRAAYKKKSRGEKE
jgi:hypothetical protein